MDALDPWGVGRSVAFHLVYLGSFDISWPNLLLGLVKPNFINWTTHCLTYYSRKQSLNNEPILFLFYCSLRHLFKFSHLFWPMWIVWETHVGLGHLEWILIWSFWACSLLLGLLTGLGLKVHVGHVLGLEHDLDLGVDLSYKPCWDHIKFHFLIWKQLTQWWVRKPLLCIWAKWKTKEIKGVARKGKIEQCNCQQTMKAWGINHQWKR